MKNYEDMTVEELTLEVACVVEKLAVEKYLAPKWNKERRRELNSRIKLGRGLLERCGYIK